MGMSFLFLDRIQSECYSIFMAKLADIQRWLEGTLGGDAPRANSLIKTVRQSGLFTTSGKGRHAPKMISSDYATAICAALVTDPPTAAPAAIAQLLNANFSYLEVTRADGCEPVLYNETIQGSDCDEYGNRILPLFYEGVPKTVLAALCQIADHYRRTGRAGVSEFDGVDLEIDGDAWIDIYLNGLDYGLEYDEEGLDTGWTENKRQTEYNWRFRYYTKRRGKVRCGRAIRVRLSCEALYGVADLAYSPDASVEGATT